MGKKILLGMSGGVDSSVTAILLKEQGYDVTGVTMKLWEVDDTDAKNICQKLDILHHTIDYKNQFKDKVINNFICEYANLRTPNPCIECNKYLKFGAMYKTAQELGIDYISTGHYAITEYSEKYGRYVLKKAKNVLKDQSYFLYPIPSNMLDKVVLPLGEFKEKAEVREIAKKYEFIKVANKPDSEDICFIPDGDYKKFLEENSDIKPKEGNIVNKNGDILGKHTGLYNYTIGQRKGIGLTHTTPLYVIGFNNERNELIVGEENELYKNELYVDHVNLLLFDEIKEKIKVSVKTRYSLKETPATIEPANDGKIKVVFENPVARITPGQSAVFYIDDIVVGGGKIV